MAARGNRITGTERFGVAFLAAAAFALAVLQSASAADATSAPATEASPATTTASAPTSEGGAATTQSEPAPAAPAPAPAPESSPSEPSSTPSTDSSEDEAPDAADPDAAPTEPTTGTATPAETTPATAPKDAVKLEEAAPASTPTPATSAPAPVSQPPAAAPPSGAPKDPVIILVQDPTPAATAPDAEAAKTEAARTEAAKTEAAKAEADDAAVEVVSLKPRPAPAAIELLPEADVESKAAPTVRVVAPARLPLVRPRTCISSTARVPLADCKRAYAVASLNITLTYLPSLPEVRAAIARGAPPRAIVRKVEARPPPESKAAQERPVAEVRPIVPFGHSGQGMTNDGFSGSSGSASKSRLFAVTLALSLRVPCPSRFARLRLPSTLPHGVIPAPPSARPG